MMLLKFLFVLFGLLAESEHFKADSKAFLFTLVDPHGNGPQKFSLCPGGNGGIQCARNLGPSFGVDSHYGLHSRYDLHLLGDINGFGGSFNLGRGFECPPNADWSYYLGGGSYLSLNELEVFQVKF